LFLIGTRALKGIQPRENAKQLTAFIAGMAMPFFFRAQNDFSRGSEKQSFCFDVLLNHFAAPAIATAITPPLPTLKNSNGFGWHLGAT